MIQTQRRQIQRALTNGHERNVTGEDGRQHKASADPLNQRSSVGWKAIKCAERLSEEYMVRVESGSTWSSQAAVN